MKRIATAALLMLLAAGSALAQNGHLTGSAEQLPQELTALLNTRDQDKVALLKQLTALWASDSLSTDVKEHVARQAAHIEPLLGDDNTPMLRYITLIIRIFKDPYAAEQYPVWNAAAEQVLNDKHLGLGQLFEFLTLSENTIYQSVMHRTPAFEWKADRHPSYKLRFERERLTVRYDNIHLVCRFKKDSVYIKSTSGEFDPSTHAWRGHGGQITWWRSGYPDDEIFVDIGHKYQLSLNKNSYTIDSVMFTNKDYFDRPNLGTVTDMLDKDYKPNNIVYPEFNSYDRWFTIDNLFDQVNYEGGFVMRGSSLIGTGSKDKLATIVITRNGKEFMRAEGNILIFQRNILNSNKASVIFRLGADSLFHTGLSFNYNNKTRTLSIAPTDRITTQSPMRSSYHKLSIWFNQMAWNIDQNQFVFSGLSGSANGQAQFESDHFFNEGMFDDMMGANDRHPLFAIWAYANQVGGNTFLAEDFAVYLRKPLDHVRIELMRIAKQGYVYYDFGTDVVTTADKLHHAISARHKKVDYDVIRFSSQCNGSTPNAVLNIDSLDMRINGIDQIAVSQVQNIYISPKNRAIVMKGNRDFEFSGTLRAGLFEFEGDHFKFNYNDFRIDLDNVDIAKLDYQLNHYDNYGQRLLSGVTSTLNKITGNILIDKPNNKSGLRRFPQYPIFNSTKESFVYYDSPKTFGGVYHRDSVYFKIYPFSYTNLNNFEKEDLVFRGIFYSKNILAPIEDSLVLRPDNSLGFVHKIPNEGFALYAGKGRAYNKIDVSDRGIMADGRITYISSTIYSPEMYLFPDSMITMSDEFTIDKRTSGITYPEVKGQRHPINWLPQRATLHAYKGPEPFVMFEQQARLRGNLLLEPLGLSGDGQVELDAALLSSRRYDFNSDDFSSPSASLKLLNPQTNEVAFSTNNIKAHIDLIDKQGRFERNDRSMFASMEPIKYEAHLDQCGWDMRSNNLTLLTPKQQAYIPGSRFYARNMHPSDTGLPGSLFYSVKYGEDSLYFLSPEAHYSTASSTLSAQHVQRVFSADAMVMPHKQHVEVTPEERMRTLKDAVVLADIDSAYHRFYNAEIRIASRRLYGGHGDYDYVDERDSVQTLHFAQITVDSTLHTYAEADVSIPDSFMLSPNFGYFGRIALRAPRKHMLYRGFTRPIYSCPGTKAEWFGFEAEIDPERILIPVGEKTRSQYLAYLTYGSVVRDDTIQLYGGFFQKRHDYADVPLVQASGLLTFNHKNRRFIVAPELKLHHPDTVGNAVMLQKDLCIMLSEGQVVLPVNLGQVKFTSIGSITHNLGENSVNIGMVSKMDFFFHRPILEMMAQRIAQNPSAQPVDLNSKTFRRALSTLIPAPKRIAELTGKLGLFGRFETLPKELESAITFAELRMTWNQGNKSFLSKGKLGIGSIGSVQVNRFVDGYLEIMKRRSGDVFNLLIKTDDHYYGFVYTRSTMQVVSSDTEFIAAINALKSKDTKMKTKSNEPAFKYLVGTSREQQIVLSRYSQLTSGIEAVANMTGEGEGDSPAEQPAPDDEQGTD